MTTLEDQVASILDTVNTLATTGVKVDQTPVLSAITGVQATVNSILAQTQPTPHPLAPTVTAISPNSGPIAGGTVVTITGTNLTGATGAMFGLVAGTNFAVTNDTTAIVTTPGQAAGAVDTVIVDAAGNSAIVPTDLFTYS